MKFQRTIQAIVIIFAISGGVPELTRVVMTVVEKMVLKKKSRRYRTTLRGKFEDSLKVTIPFIAKLKTVDTATAMMLEMETFTLKRRSKL